MALYQRATDVELRTIAGESFLIVMHAGESKMFTLNGMGVWFWEQLARPVDHDTLLKAMLAEYEVGAAEARAEVERFMAHLLDKGLVMESTARTPC